jgi:hypothetical protein
MAEDSDAAQARDGAGDIWLVGSSGVDQFCSYHGSIGIVATQKRSISFDESVLREAELRIAESGGNLSAFVNAALLHELQVARGRELLAEDDAEFGAVPAEVETQVLAEWPGLTLDAGALIAYERGQERIRKILAVSYERGLVPTIPAVAVAEVWRGDAKDARVARLLKASSIEILDERIARSREPATDDAGASTIDACIAVGVRRRGDAIATSDPGDMRALLGEGFTILTV